MNIQLFSVIRYSKALEIAGVTKDTPNPVGGVFEKDENGELTTYDFTHGSTWKENMEY